MQKFECKDLLYFDKMVTPMLVQILYWVIAGLMIICGVLAVLFCLINLNIGGIISGFLFIVLGPLFVRIWFELVLVIFKIYEKVSKIADKD